MARKRSSKAFTQSKKLIDALHKEALTNPAIEFKEKLALADLGLKVFKLENDYAPEEDNIGLENLKRELHNIPGSEQ